MKAKMNFTHGGRLYVKGGNVPDELAAKYPHLCEAGEAAAEEVKEYAPVEKEKVEMPVLSTKKAEKKSNGK